MSEQQPTQQRIAEIRARVEAATPGPWRQGRVLQTYRTKHFPQEMFDRAQERERRTVFAGFSEADQGRSREVVTECRDDSDAALIAQAREDVPWLLDQLAAALDALRELHDFSGDPHHYRDIATYQAAKADAAQILKEHGA